MTRDQALTNYRWRRAAWAERHTFTGATYTVKFRNGDTTAVREYRGEK